jgi:hypothetical protein
MSFGPKEIQRAVFGALKNDLDLSRLVTGIYDFIPQEKCFPFVQVGEATHEERDSHTTNGFTSTIHINCWSQVTNGRGKCLDIQGAIYDALHKANLAIDCFATVTCHQSFSTIIVEDDTVTYHGIQRFTIMIGENI